MNLPTVEPIPPEDHQPLPPARRRRKQRSIIPPGESDRASLLSNLSARLVPSFDFFLFSLLSSMLLGVALLLDSPSLIFLSVLVAPFIAPVMGISLGAISGAARFSLHALVSLLIASLIVFLSGMLSGWATTLLPRSPHLQAAAHSQFTWASFAVLLIGAGFTTYRMVRDPNNKPPVLSLALAYGLYLPLGAAGFGAGSGQLNLLFAGLQLFTVHLTWVILIHAGLLAILGLRPLKALGYLVLCFYLFTTLAASGMAYYYQNPSSFYIPSAIPTPTTPILVPSPTTATSTSPVPPTSTVSPTPIPPTSTPSITPEPPTPTFTPTRTLIPSRTPTITLSPAPTPIWARITAKEGNGVLVRGEPSFASNVVQSLRNDTLVVVLPETITTDGVTWVKVRTVNDKIGWVVSSLLTTATPSP